MDQLQRVQAQDLVSGVRMDLEGDKYADPTGTDPRFATEYIECFGVEAETDDCVRVDYNGGSFGCPSDHIIKVRRDWLGD